MFESPDRRTNLGARAPKGLSLRIANRVGIVPGTLVYPQRPRVAVGGCSWRFSELSSLEEASTSSSFVAALVAEGEVGMSAADNVRPFRLRRVIRDSPIRGVTRDFVKPGRNLER